jgi:membrane protein implicated in regulation of membrane protease activity
MDKVKWNYIVDILILIAFVIVAITGLLKWPGLGFHKFLPMMQLTNLHDWSGLIAVILAFVHVALNWKFMTSMTKKYFSRE